MLLHLYASLALSSALLVSAHGDHGAGLEDGDDTLGYAERHMQSEHHIDGFDLESFFKLHDLDNNGLWDVPEIEAVYGLHHHSVAKKVHDKDERAKEIVEKVLAALDTNKDGVITLTEYLAGGNDGLPSFKGYQHLGHHYDEESEYFLHHEEMYHSTPETQTDESYNHPEDLEHFAHHQHIEAEEDARERVFEGLPEDADVTVDHVASDPLAAHAHEGEVIPDDAQHPLKAGDPMPDKPLARGRVDPNAQPQRLVTGRKPTEEERKAEWETAKAEAGKQPKYGHDGSYRAPRNPEERLRSGVPYKYKFRKGLRADEF